MAAPRPGRPSDYDLLFKVTLIGDSNVGKSAIMRRIVEDAFTDEFIPTIGVEFMLHLVRYAGKTIKLQIWDTAGQERFRAITSAYYRGSNVAAIVYDVTNRRTFEHCQVLYTQFLMAWPSLKTSGRSTLRGLEMGTPLPPMVLIACKTDAPLDAHRVTPEEGQALAASWGGSHTVTFMEVSARTGENIRQLFVHIARAAMYRAACA